MPEAAKRPLVIVTYLVLILSIVAVYSQVGSFGFTNYDDDKYVSGNPHVFRDGIAWAFTTGYANNWHPVTWLSHMLDCRLFGPGPGWMHLENVLLHIANTLLLFAVLKRMTGSLWPSAFVAAAFAIHPMHVESVAWIAERKDVLSTFFLLLTLAAYVGYVRRRTTLRYLLTLALFALGLMAKPMLVTLPLVLLLLDYWPLERFEFESRKRDGGASLYGMIIEKVPFLVLAAASSVITFLVQQSGGAAVNANPLKDRVANAILSYARYMGQMFWPRDMAVLYPFDAGGVPFRQVAAIALLLFVITIVVVRYGRSRKYLAVGWFWFVGTLVPVIGLVQVGRHAFADRYTYVPYIGLFVAMAWGLAELPSKLPYRKALAGVAMAVVLASMGICAHRQVGYWKDSVTLFSHAIEVTRNNYLAYGNRGGAYIGLGRRQEAMADLGEAIRIKPDYAEAHTSLGIVYGELGRRQEAMDAHRQAIRLRPDLGEAYNNLAWLIATSPDFKGRDPNEAVRLAERACELSNYQDPAVLDTLGAAYASAGRSDEAVDTAKRALRLADAAGLVQLKGAIQQHLSLYAQGRPYAAPAPKPKPEPDPNKS